MTSAGGAHTPRACNGKERAVVQFAVLVGAGQLVMAAITATDRALDASGCTASAASTQLAFEQPGLFTHARETPRDVPLKPAAVRR